MNDKKAYLRAKDLINRFFYGTAEAAPFVGASFPNLVEKEASVTIACR
jgi:hypothetical protein